MRRVLSVLSGAVLAAATLAACGGSGDTGASPSATPTAVDCAALPTLTEGTLTVGTSVPYLPWYDGEASSGKGFESALVYAVADRLGFAKDAVTWDDVTFDQMISPARKPFDLAAYQVTVTPERAKAVDFSSPYLDSQQALVVREADKGGTTLADYENRTIGVTASQTSLTVAQAAWGEKNTYKPFDDAGAAMQALSNEQVDGVVMDLAQALAATSTYFPGTAVAGALPAEGAPEQLAFVLDKDSPLTGCVTKAVDELRADGTLDELRATWLVGIDDVATLD